MSFSGGTTDTYNATTTWTVPTVAVNGYNVTAVNVMCYGGGGGGGGASATSGGGGGGGGGFSQTNALAVTPGEVITITVGTGGAAAGAGGVSWFRSAVTIQALGGGAGGAGGVSAGGTAGAAGALGTGTTRFAGGAGAAGNAVTTGGAGGGGAGDAANGGGAVTTTVGAGGSAGGGSGGVVPTGAGAANGGGGGGGTSVTGTAGGVGSRGQVQVNYLRQFGKSPTETVGSASATVARVFAGGRTQTETTPTKPAADTPTPILTRVRNLSETVGPAADTITRTVAFNKTVAETLTASQTVSRAFVGARTGTETVGPASAAVARVATFARIIGEGPGDYPANNGQKSIAGIVKDEDTGVAVAGVTVYLVRASDLVYTGQSRTTAGDGSYTFLRDFGDANSYLVLVKNDGGTPPRHGVSDEGLIPA